MVKTQVALGHLRLHAPADEQRDQDRADRHHDVGREVIDQIENRLAREHVKHAERVDALPTIERQHAEHADAPAEDAEHDAAEFAAHLQK